MQLEDAPNTMYVHSSPYCFRAQVSDLRTIAVSPLSAPTCAMYARTAGVYVPLRSPILLECQSAAQRGPTRPLSRSKGNLTQSNDSPDSSTGVFLLLTLTQPARTAAWKRSRTALACRTLDAASADRFFAHRVRSCSLWCQ